MPSGNPDRFLLWPIVLLIGLSVGFVLVCSGPFVLRVFGAPLIVLGWLVSVAAAIVMLVMYLVVERAWRRAVSTLALPLTLLLAVNFESAWRAGQLAGDYVHLLALYALYRVDIANERGDEPRLLVYDWGGFVMGNGVVYDESDEIGLPSAKRSEAWKKRAARVGADRVYGYTHAFAHFYFVGLD